MYRPDLECAPLEVLRALQLERLNRLLAEVLPRNRFCARKLRGASPPLQWDAFFQLPFTTKAELVADQTAHPPAGSVLTYPRDQYVTFHQTSGTTGTPLIVLDTEASWSWWAECWQFVYAAADVTAADRIFFAFSFGPFIGFWSARAGARRLGALVIPGGGMDSKARLRAIEAAEATVLVSTPTYALHLAEVARAEGLSLADLPVRTTIHAGEPGGSIPAVRGRIEDAWGARTFDHAGGTEVGAFAYMCSAQSGLHVNEAEFIAEVLDPERGGPVAEGDVGELVLTNLGRAGWPAVRYRTGDLVRAGGRRCPCGRTFLHLPGGIIGRVDDLIVLRGVNVYPSAIEAIVREFEAGEFRIVREQPVTLEELRVEVEGAPDVVRAIGAAFRQRIGVRIETVAVPVGTLPRWELKARRVVDRR